MELSDFDIIYWIDDRKVKDDKNYHNGRTEINIRNLLFLAKNLVCERVDLVFFLGDKKLTFDSGELKEEDTNIRPCEHPIHDRNISEYVELFLNEISRIKKTKRILIIMDRIGIDGTEHSSQAIAKKLSATPNVQIVLYSANSLPVDERFPCFNISWSNPVDAVVSLKERLKNIEK